MSLAILMMSGGGYLLYKSKRLLWKIVAGGLIFWGFIGLATILAG